MGNYDTILIPGGGVREKGELPLWVQRRLGRAVEIHGGEYLIALSAGTPHKRSLHNLPNPMYYINN